MTITNGLITLAQAKLSIYNGNPVATYDSDIEDYITAATPVIEEITGPMYVRNETRRFNGGNEVVCMPWPFTSIVSITEGGVVTTDYTPDPATGLIWAGSSTSPRYWAVGRYSVVVIASVGPATVPMNVQLATRELVRHLWQVGRQGNRPAYGNEEMTETPSGFAVPRRVVDLCRSNRQIGGFA